MKIDTRKTLSCECGTIRFRRLDGRAAKAQGADYAASFSSYAGGAEAIRINGVWAPEPCYGRNNSEFAAMLNTMEAAK